MSSIFAKNVHYTLETPKLFFDELAQYTPGLAQYAPLGWLSSFFDNKPQPTLPEVREQLQWMRKAFKSCVNEDNFDCFKHLEAFKLVFKSIGENKNINSDVRELIEGNLNKLDAEKGSSIICDKLKRIQEKPLNEKDFKDLSRMIRQSKMFLLCQSAKAQSLLVVDHARLLISLLDFWDAKIKDIDACFVPGGKKWGLPDPCNAENTRNELRDLIEMAYVQLWQRLPDEEYEELSGLCLDMFFAACQKPTSRETNILAQIIPFYENLVNTSPKEENIALLNTLKNILLRA